jgi:hypothetical protein
LTACSIALKPSLTLAAILAALHLAAFGAAFASLSGLPAALVCAGVLVSAACSVADALQRLPSSVLWMELQEDGTGRWRDRIGREHPVRATQASWASPGLIVLGLGGSRWRTRWVVLLPDSAPAQALRSLRVYLKWRPARKAV